MTNREILLEMYEKLWNADKDKWSWNVILKDTLEKLENNNDTEQQGFVSLIEPLTPKRNDKIRIIKPSSRKT